jgi:hypothetical protein
LPRHLAREAFDLTVLIFDVNSITSDISLLSSAAIIVGTIVIVLQLRQGNRIIQASTEQAKAAAVQTRLTTEQLRQNNELANMDMIMRLYEFANTAEFQSAWLTVISSRIKSFQDFMNLPKPEQVSFFQIAALFESIGVLVDRKIVTQGTVSDMFLTQTAWNALQPFINGMREKYGDEESYTFFERLHKALPVNGAQT